MLARTLLLSGWLIYGFKNEANSAYLAANQPAQSKKAVAVPKDAIRIRVGSKGFRPDRLEIPAGRAATLAITRENEANCGAQVVFPDLGIQREVPLGGTVVIELPAQAAGEYRFACGMNMYRGMLVVK